MASLFGNIDDERQRIREQAIAGWGVSGIVDSRNGDGVDMITKKFNPEQPRDEHGRWTIGQHVEITSGVYRGHHGTVLRSNPNGQAHDVMLDGGRGRQAHQVPADALAPSTVHPDVSQHMDAIETMMHQQPGNEYDFREAQRALALHNYAAAGKRLRSAAANIGNHDLDDAGIVNDMAQSMRDLARDARNLRETNRVRAQLGHPPLDKLPTTAEAQAAAHAIFAKYHPEHADEIPRSVTQAHLNSPEVQALSPAQREAYINARRHNMGHKRSLDVAAEVP